MPPRKATAKRARGGASSSSRAPRVIFDENRFLLRILWFEKMKGDCMIVEKSLHPRIDAEVPIRAEFDKFGWGALLDVKGDYYPELVWQFYANMEDKDITGMDVIRTFVKGVRIELTSDFLAQILNVPNDGPPLVYNQIDIILSDLGYSIVQVARCLVYFKVQTGSRSSFLPTHIPLIDRLICFFIGANIVPRKSGNNELRNLDIYIVDKFLNGLGAISAIPVATIIIAHMRHVTHMMTSARNAKQHALFAISILRIMAVLGVDLSGVTSFAPTTKHMLSAPVMTGMYFIYRQGTWWRNPDSQNLRRHVRDPGIPPPTAEELALEARVQDDVPLEHTDEPRADISSSTGHRGALAEFILLLLIVWIMSSRMARLEHHAMTHTYSPDINAPPYDRSVLADLEESDSATDDE